MQQENTSKNFLNFSDDRAARMRFV